MNNTWVRVVLLTAVAWSTCTQPVLSEEAVDEWQQLMIVAVQTQKAGDLDRAERLANEALAIARQAQPADIRLARSHMLLGEIHRWKKDYAAAEQSLKEAVSTCERLVGPNDPRMIPSLDSLANFYYYHDAQYDKVLPLYQRLLRIVERDPSLDQRDVAQRARNLGNIYRFLDKPNEAESYYKSAVAQVEAISPYSPDLPQFLLTLAEFYCHNERFAEAEPTAKRALAICVDGLGTDSLGTAVSLDGLAAVYLAWGKADEAEPLYAQALDITENIVGLHHSDLAPRLVGLADSQCKQGKFREAETNYQRALTVVEKGLGRNAQELIPILESYAMLLKRTRRTKDATSNLVRVESIRESLP